MSQIPHVTRQEYTLLDINEDGFVSVLISMPEHICNISWCTPCQPLLESSSKHCIKPLHQFCCWGGF